MRNCTLAFLCFVLGLLSVPAAQAAPTNCSTSYGIYSVNTVYTTPNPGGGASGCPIHYNISSQSFSCNGVVVYSNDPDHCAGSGDLLCSDPSPNIPRIGTAPCTCCHPVPSVQQYLENSCGDCPIIINYGGGETEICGDGVDNNDNGETDEGCGGSQGGVCVGSPIHLATGNMFLKHADFSITTGSLPIQFTRTYNSNFHTVIEHRESRLGYGWRHNYQSEVILPNENTNVTGPPTWYKVIVGSRTLSFSKNGTDFVPQHGSGGFQFSENTQYWILTLPGGIKYLYNKTDAAAPPTGSDDNSYRQLVRIVAPNGNYLKLTYRTHDGVQYSLWQYLRSKYLKSVQPYFKDDSVAGKGISFSYTPYQGNWRIEKIARTHESLSVSPSCTSDADCQSTGGECIITIPQQTHSGSTYGDETSGRCGKRLLRFHYQNGNLGETQGQLAFRGTVALAYKPRKGGGGGGGGGRSVIKTGKSPGSYMSIPANPFENTTTADLTEVRYGSSEQLVYTYTYQNIGTTGKRKLTKAQDADGKILEEHEYDATTGKAKTSKSAKENLSVVYVSNTEFRVTRTYGDSNTKEQTYIIDATTKQLKSKSGPCDCSMVNESIKWKTPQAGYTALVSSVKERGKQAYKTFDYSFTGNKMVSKTVVVGDDDDNAVTVPQDALKVTTYYHPTIPKLPIAVERKSIKPGAGSNDFMQVIYDYDSDTEPTRCQNPDTCSRTGFNNNPGSLLYRIIRKGYTKTTIGGSWSLVTRVINFEYDSLNRLIKVTGPRTGQQTEYSYYPASETDIKKRYMLKEIKVQVIDPRVGTPYTLTTTYNEYNEYGTPSKITRPDSSVHEVTFDAFGLAQFIKKDLRKTLGDPASTATWSIYRDLAGRPTFMGKPNGAGTAYSYDSYGRVSQTSFRESQASADKVLASYFYNDAGQITKVERNQVKDSSGNVLSKRFEYSFGTNDEKIVKVYPSLPKTHFQQLTYNLNGTIGETLDENGQKTELLYHSHRKWVVRATKYTSAGNTNPIVIEYSHNILGQVTHVVDPKGVDTSYEYDDFGQLLQTTSSDRAPSSNPVRFAYDASGNVISKQRADGVTIGFQYDTLNRLIKTDYPAPTGSNPYLTDNDVEYFYDEANTSFSAGRLTRVTVKMFKSSGTDVVRTVRYYYDAAGRVKQKQIDEGGSYWNTQFNYDAEGSLTEISYPVFYKKYTYTYNSASQFLSLNYSANSTDSIILLQSHYLLADDSSGPGGVLKSTDVRMSELIPGGGVNYLGNAVQTGYLLNGAAVVDNGAGSPGSSYMASGPTLSDGLTGHAGLVSRKYEHTKNGLVQSFTCLNSVTGGDGCFPGNRVSSFAYDGLYRLTTANVGSDSFTYTYDNNGNTTRQTKSSTGEDWTLEYTDGTNRLSKRYPYGTTPPSSANYLQQTDGKRSEDPYWTYTYHTNGRLAVMTPKAGNSGRTVVFAYDHKGRRVRKMSFESGSSYNDSTTYFYGLGGDVLEEYKVDSSLKSYYRSWLWVGSRIVAGEFSETGGTDSKYQFYYYHHDHLGRPVAVTDPGGIPVWRSAADPYGKDAGLGLKDGASAYKQVLLSTPNHITTIGYAAGKTTVTKDLIEPGTFGIQFKFKTLKVSNHFDSLAILTSSATSGDTVIHNFTGDHQTGVDGNPGTPFWGPVIQFRAKDIGSAGALGRLLFELDSASGSVSVGDGYEITDYRLWYVPGGDTATTAKSDSPNPSTSTYSSNQIWSQAYNQTDAKLIRVCFSSFDVEAHYDKVEIRDSADHIIQVLSGRNLGEFCSAWVQGSQLRVRFETDYSVEYAGFVVSRVEGLTTPEIKARFPGQWHEKETTAKDTNGNQTYAALHYNWHRFYDTEVGRYTTPDPIGLAGGTNVYAYVGGNPTNASDFLGLRPGPGLCYTSFDCAKGKPGYAQLAREAGWSRAGKAAVKALVRFGVRAGARGAREEPQASSGKSETIDAGDCPSPDSFEHTPYDGPVLPDERFRKDRVYFLHGTPTVDVPSILSGIKAVEGNKNGYPGGFFVFEVNSSNPAGSLPAFVAASHMGMLHTANQSIAQTSVMLGSISRRTYNSLLAQGLLIPPSSLGRGEDGAMGGAPPETIFLPGPEPGFVELNANISWHTVFPAIQ